jgi:drug/metabolite transporter (DMT)-like permease
MNSSENSNHSSISSDHSTNKNRIFIGAALLMILSVSLFTVSHGLVRQVGEDIHPLEIAFSTSVFSFTFYLPWLIRNGFGALKTNQIRIHWVRALLNAGGVCGWYFALTMTPLADAVALSLTGPLVVTLGAVLFMGEPARLRRWVAMGIGIAGALLIIRPGFQSFVPGYWFVLFSVFCVAGSRLYTKFLTQTENPASIGAWMALLQVPITFALMVYYWTLPNLMQLMMMFVVGLMVGGAHYSLTLAYDRAEVGALEPLNLIRLVIAALIGYFIFSEIPDIWTWIGGVVIVASTTFIAYREAVRRRDGLK